MKKSILIIAGALVLSSLSAFASDIKTYPVQGVFLADTISNPNFVNLVKKEARTTFIPKFMKEFNDNFDNTLEIYESLKDDYSLGVIIEENNKKLECLCRRLKCQKQEA